AAEPLDLATAEVHEPAVAAALRAEGLRAVNHPCSLRQRATMASEVSAMEGVNAISVLGRDLLLVEVGGGAETQLAGATDDSSARAAIAVGRTVRSRSRDAAGARDDTALLEPRWAASTLCGRAWHEMAAGEGGMLHHWQETSLAPTCRSCLRVVDTWFPKADAPAGIELLALIVAEKVEGSAPPT